MINFLKHKYNQAREALHALGAKYFIVVSYVEKEPGDASTGSATAAPTLKDQQYVILEPGAEAIKDYTSNPREATCVDFLLGTIIVKTMRKELADTPNLQVDLVTVSDALFMEDVVKGPDPKLEISN